MIYIIEIRVPDETEHRIVEESADDFLCAATQLSQRWPRVHLVKLHGCYSESTKVGRA